MPTALKQNLKLDVLEILAGLSCLWAQQRCQFCRSQVQQFAWIKLGLKTPGSNTSKRQTKPGLWNAVKMLTMDPTVPRTDLFVLHVGRILFVETSRLVFCMALIFLEVDWNVLQTCHKTSPWWPNC